MGSVYTCDSCVLELSKLPQTERDWYSRLQEKAGLCSLTEAVIVHSGMYMIQGRIRMGKSGKQ